MSKTIAQMVPFGIRYYQDGRDEYHNKTGRQARPFDVKKLARAWEGADDGSFPAYDFLAPGGMQHHAALPPEPASAPSLIDAFLGKQPWGGINLPGKYQYTNYAAWLLTRPSSQVYCMVDLQFIGKVRQNVGKDALYLPDEAQAVVNEMGPGAGVTLELAADFDGQPAEYFYGDDKRRVYTLKRDDGKGNVSLTSLSAIFKQRTDGTDNGIGTPGSWIVDDARYQWVGVPGDHGENATAYVPVPSLPLAVDEEVAFESVNNMPASLVVRTKGSTVIFPNTQILPPTTRDVEILEKLDAVLGFMKALASR